MAVNRLVYAIVVVGLFLLTWSPGPVNAQSRTLVVDWSGGDSPQRIGAGAPDESPSMTDIGRQTSWTKTFEALPPSPTVDLHILYDRDPLILPVRFLPRQTTKRLYAAAQPVDCFVQSAQAQDSRLTNNFSSKSTVMSVILTATVALDTYCRPSDRDARSAFRRLLARALRQYLALDKSLDLRHFGPKIVSVAPQLAASLKPSRKEFAVAAMEWVNGVLSGEATLEQQRLAIGELLELGKQEELADLIDAQKYLPRLINIEFQETSSLITSTDYGNPEQVQALWSRIERLESVANAPEGSEEFAIFQEAGIPAGFVSWLNSSARHNTRVAVATRALKVEDTTRLFVIETDNGIDNVPGRILGQELPVWAVSPDAGLAQIEAGAMAAAANNAAHNCC